MKTIKSNKEGKNIHSPFVYRLVANVLFAPYPFYAFEKIDKLASNRAENEILKLNFRLVNHFNADTIFEVGDTYANLQSVCTMVRPDIKFEHCDYTENLHSKIGCNDYNRIIIFHNPTVSNKPTIFPNDREIWIFFREKAKNDMPLFTELKSEKNVQVTIELRYMGIVIFDNKLDKQNYVIK